MNFMRKVLGGGAGGPPGTQNIYFYCQILVLTFKGPGGGATNSASYQPEQELLGLNHLKKLYTEYSQPLGPLSSAEKVQLSLGLIGNDGLLLITGGQAVRHAAPVLQDLQCRAA